MVSQGSNRKIVALVCNEHHADIIASMVRQAGEETGNEVVVIGLEYCAQSRLEELGIAYKIPEDYADHLAYQSLDEKATSLAGKWYCFDPDVEQEVTYEGINLGRIVEWEFTYFFAGVMKYTELLNRVYDVEQPDEVLMATNGPPVSGITEGREEYLALKVAAMIAKQRGIQVNTFTHSAPSLAAPRFTTKGILLAAATVTTSTLNFLRRFAPKRGKSVVLFATGWTEASPVVRQLQKKSGARVFFFSREPAISSNSMRANLFQEIRTFGNYQNKETKRKREITSSRFRARWPVIRDCESLRKIMVYQHSPIWDVVEERLYYLFSSKFTELANNIELAGRMLARERAQLIVLNNGVSEFDRTLITVADKKGIPSLINQREMAEPPISWLPFFAGKLACWGQITRDWLVKEGVNSGKIVITGASRFDAYVNRKKTAGIGEGLIVLAAQPGNKASFANVHLSQRENEALLRAVVAAMKEFPEHRLVVKLHPGDENASRNEAVVKETAAAQMIDNVAVARFTNIGKLLSKTDVLITPWSTVGLEAMILEKPVIQANLTGRPMPDFVNLYASRGAALGVTTPADIAPVIRRILNDPNTRRSLQENVKRFLSDYCYAMDGRSSERVADLILRTIEESRK